MKRVISFQTGAAEAEWLERWVAEHASGSDQGEGQRSDTAQALAAQAEEAARQEGLQLRPALRMKGYSNLADYIHDWLDEEADE